MIQLDVESSKHNTARAVNNKGMREISTEPEVGRVGGCRPRMVKTGVR